MAGDKHIPDSKWNDKFPQMAFEYALLGYTLQQVAQTLDVHLQTVKYWLAENKGGFAEKWNEGRDRADSKVVSELYKNCFDRYVTEEEGRMYHGEMKVVKVKKFIPGDVKAQSRWLSLRQKALWSEGTKIEFNQTNINLTKIDITGLTNEELKLARKMQLSILPQDITEDGD
jgi:hypothetical protein